MPSHCELRAGASCAILGTVLLVAGTYLHPVPDDPNDALVSFKLYAADRFWLISHFSQLSGIALMIGALVILARQLETKTTGGWPSIAQAGAVASLAVVSALQAVDGVALKRMVDAWAAASVMEKAATFQAAFAVRQIEIGLASISSLILGPTATIYGVAILSIGVYPTWTGGIAIVGGVATALSGVIIAATGFSATAMAVNMPASLLLIVWTLIIGIMMWRSTIPRFDE